MALTQLTAQLLRDLNTVVNESFKQGMATAKESPVSQLCMTTSGIGETTSFPFMAYFPEIKKLVGEAKFSQVIDSIYQIKNTPYQAGIEINVLDVMRRNDSLYASIIERAAREAQLTPSYEALELLKLAFDPSAKDFTGKAFFDVDKPYFATPKGFKDKMPDGKWTNKGADVLSTAALNAGIANIQNRRGPNGRQLHLGMGNMTLCVSPIDGTYANMIVKQRAHYASNDTPLFGQVTVLPVAGIPENQWFLFDADDVLKPIVINEELPFTIKTTADNPNDSDIIKNSRIIYSVFGSYGIGWGSSLHAYGSTGKTGAKDKFPSQV